MPFFSVCNDVYQQLGSSLEPTEGRHEDGHGFFRRRSENEDDWKKIRASDNENDNVSNKNTKIYEKLQVQFFETIFVNVISLFRVELLLSNRKA